MKDINSNDYKEFHQYNIYKDGTFENSKTGLCFSGLHHKGRIETRLTIEGKRKSYIVSRLLYWLFIEQFDYNNKNLCVSYKDGNSLNISIDNLYLTERKNLIQGSGHRNRIKLSDEQVKEIKESYKGKSGNNQHDRISPSLNQLADKYKVTKSEIHQIIKGRTRNPDKYKFK